MKKKFSLFSLANREQKKTKAGLGMCYCACAWVNCGGASAIDNDTSNYNSDLESKDTGPRDSEGNPIS